MSYPHVSTPIHTSEPPLYKPHIATTQPSLHHSSHTALPPSQQPHRPVLTLTTQAKLTAGIASISSTRCFRKPFMSLDMMELKKKMSIKLRNSQNYSCKSNTNHLFIKYVFKDMLMLKEVIKNPSLCLYIYNIVAIYHSTSSCP